MSWKIFIIPKWDKSVLKSDPELTLNNDVLTFIKDGEPVIPGLKLDGGGTFPRVAQGEDKTQGYTYTLNIWVKDPTSIPRPIFLGQLVKVDTRTKEEWYDTVLALPSDDVLPGTVSDYDGDIEELNAPAERLIKDLTQGSIYRVDKPYFEFKQKGGDNVRVQLNIDAVYPSNFYCNQFGIPNDPTQYQLGGRYVSMLTPERHVLFGHIQWGSDRSMAMADGAVYAPGDKTEPFLAIQPPPGDGTSGGDCR